MKQRTALRLRAADMDELLKQARAGSSDAHGELFRRYHAYAHSIARDAGSSDADEAVSEAFRRTTQAMNAGNGPTRSFGAYIATAVKSVAADQRCRDGRVTYTDDDTVLDSASVPVEHGVVADEHLRNAYFSLPSRWREVVWMTEVEGSRLAEVAEALGLPSSNAVSALRVRARAGLRAAYLTELVGDAHTPEVTAHLLSLIAGDSEAESVNEAVEWHLEQCPECEDIYRVVNQVSGRRLRELLSPVVLSVILATTGGGAGATGPLGAVRRLWSKMQGVTGAAVATAATITAAGLAVFAFSALSSDAAATAPPNAVAPNTVSASPPTSTSTSTSTTSTTTTTSTPATTTTTVAPPPVIVAVPSTESPTTSARSAAAIPATVAPSPPIAATTTTPAPTPAMPTTTMPTTTMPMPSTTTTMPSTTTTMPPPSEPVGALGISWGADPEGLSGTVFVVDVSGAPGYVVFSHPVSTVTVTATCVDNRCDFDGSSEAQVSFQAPDTQTISFALHSADGRLDDHLTVARR